MNKSKEDSLLSIPPFDSSHNPFQSCGKIYEVKFFSLQRGLRENNGNVVVVVDGNNRNVEKEKKGCGKVEK